MKPGNIGVALCIAAALTSMLSYADDHRKERRDDRKIDSGMRAVPIGKGVGQPEYGWRYFTDAREGTAVVISPSGDYYYSSGEGLKLVFKAITAV
jgi:hypothetical protein